MFIALLELSFYIDIARNEVLKSMHALDGV